MLVLQRSTEAVCKVNNIFFSIQILRFLFGAMMIILVKSLYLVKIIVSCDQRNPLIAESAGRVPASPPERRCEALGCGQAGAGVTGLARAGAHRIESQLTC